jgi:DNA polymerase III delta subunit
MSFPKELPKDKAISDELAYNFYMLEKSIILIHNPEKVSKTLSSLIKTYQLLKKTQNMPVFLEIVSLLELSERYVPWDVQSPAAARPIRTETR